MCKAWARKTRRSGVDGRQVLQYVLILALPNTVLGGIARTFFKHFKLYFVSSHCKNPIL